MKQKIIEFLKDKFNIALIVLQVLAIICYFLNAYLFFLLLFFALESAFLIVWGVKYFVVKNTLLRLAAKEVGLDALDESLHGPTALAVSDEDAVAPAKVIADYAKDAIKAGIDSRITSACAVVEEILSVSSICVSTVSIRLFSTNSSYSFFM